MTKDWLTELRESQQNIACVGAGLDRIADGLVMAGIGEELRGDLRRYSYMLHKTNLAVHRASSGASMELYETAQSAIYNILGLALAMCELEEKDGQDHGT